MSRRRQRAVSVTLSAFLLCLSAAAPPARAAYDPPLTVQMIKDDWRINPDQDPQAYIDLTVAGRGVGFLPTRGVRQELKNYGVPAVVIDSLRLHVHESAKFKIQVWTFEAESGTLSEQALNDLAQRIFTELGRRSDGLSEVFPHFKPALSETCNGCPDTSEPRLHVKGTVRRQDDGLEAELRMSYKSTSQDETINVDSKIKFENSGDVLQSAASEITSKVHNTLRQEIRGPLR